MGSRGEGNLPERSLMNTNLSPMQQYQHLSKYARWNGARRETFNESVSRSMDWLIKAVYEATGYRLTQDETLTLSSAMLGMEAFPSLRLFQMAGPSLDRCNVGLYNCSAVAMDRLSAFSELMYNLMQGTGVGFSVEQKFVSQLPAVLPRI